MDLKLKSKLENDMSLLSFDFNLRSIADDGISQETSMDISKETSMDKARRQAWT